jgi:hypothetical protein
MLPACNKLSSEVLAMMQMVQGVAVVGCPGGICNREVRGCRNQKGLHCISPLAALLPCCLVLTAQPRHYLTVHLPGLPQHNKRYLHWGFQWILVHSLGDYLRGPGTNKQTCKSKLDLCQEWRILFPAAAGVWYSLLLFAAV